MSQLSSRARVELARAALSRIGLESPELRPYQDEPAQNAQRHGRQRRVSAA